MEITIVVDVRAAKGTKKELSTLRAGSRIPAVVYGGENPPLNIALSEREFMDARKKGGVNAILRLKHPKGEETVMVKELQRHPVTDRPDEMQARAAYFGQDLPEPVDDALLVLLNHLERARGRDYPEYDQDHDDSNNCTHRDHLSS